MSRPFPRFFRSWMIVPCCALAFLVWMDRGVMERVEFLSAIDRDGTVADASSPTGYAGKKRWLIVPTHNNHSYQWIAETQQMLAGKEWRVRRVDNENAPFGREVQSASPYRWWLELVAWCDREFSGRSPGLSVERAALFADPVLHLLLLAGTVVFAARRFGAFPAALISIGLAAAFPFATIFLPGSPDIHGLAQALALWSVLPLLAGISGPLLRADGDAPAMPGNPETTARKSRWFFVAGIIGGLGLWVSATSQAPILVGIVFGATVAAGAAGTGAKTNSSGKSSPLPWRTWALGGAITSLFAYLAEYYPAHMDLRLQVNHPLYGLAWLGVGELLARLEAWRARQASPWRLHDGIALVVATLSVAALPVVMMANKNFPATDSLGTHLSNLSDGAVAKNFAAWIRRDGLTGEVAATCLPVVLLVPVVWLLLRRATATVQRRALAVGIGPVLVALLLAFSQLRWWAMFEGMLLAPLMVAAAAAAPANLRRSRQWWGGVACAALGCGLFLLVPPAKIGKKEVFFPLEMEGLMERSLAHWIADHAGPEGATVLVPPDRTAGFCFHGGLRGLGTPNWENRDGLAATIRIVSATSADEAQALLGQRGVTHIVLPSWDTDLDEFARWTVGRPEDSFIHALHRWALPPWLRPLPYQLPKVAGFENQTVTILEVNDETDGAAALGRLAEYFLEMQQPDLAGAAGQKLLLYPSNTGALVARAEIAKALGNAEEFTATFNSLLANLAGGLDRNLAWDRRVSLAVTLAQGNRTDLARQQLQRCLQDISELRIRSLATGSLYRLQVLGKAFDQKIADPTQRELARQLLPAELRARL